MLYLVLAMISSMLVSVLMRVSEKYARGNVSLLAVNYAACTLMAALFSGDIFPAAEGLGLTLCLGAINGALFLSGFMLLKWNIRKNGVVLPATFMRLGVLVPTLMSIAVFGEKPGLMQIAGIVLAIAAIFIMQEGGKGGAARSVGGLIILLAAGGCCDAMSKIFEETGPAALKDHFLMYTFAVALILCVIICVMRRERPGRMDVIFGLLIGIPNYLSTRFLLWSLNEVPAVAAYPSYSVGAIVLVMAVGMAVFHERLSRRKLTALAAILVSLALLNL